MIEKGKRSDYHQTTLRSLEQVLGWEPTSYLDVLQGREPRLAEGHAQDAGHVSEADELVAQVARSRFDRQTKTALIAVIRAAEAEQEQRHAASA